MLKRFVDLVLASIALVLLAPLILVVALLVLRWHGRPIFFVQTRPGRYGRPFRLVKFRTMTEACGPDGKLLPDTQRLTRLGSFLRATSLDELPELWNVLKGDMSLVGPRPLLMRYLPYFTDEERERFNVRPGITGWAQINGRNFVPWDERLRMDVWYVRNQNLWLDLKILAMTAWQVLHRRDVKIAADGRHFGDLDHERSKLQH